MSLKVISTDKYYSYKYIPGCVFFVEVSIKNNETLKFEYWQLCVRMNFKCNNTAEFLQVNADKQIDKIF